jgi:hypothetical protein
MVSALPCIFSLFFPAVCFFGGVFFLYKGALRFLLLQSIANTPTSRSSSAAVGLVELFGTVHCPQPFKSHITGKACTYSKVVGRYFDPADKKWKHLFKLEKVAPFHLQDAGGKMLIDPTGADINMSPEFTHQGYLFRGPKKKEMGLLDPFIGEVSKPVGKAVGGVYDAAFPAMKSEPAFGAPAEASDDKVVTFLRDSKELAAFLERHSKHTIEVTEYILPESVEAYVIGTASIREKGHPSEGELVVKKGRFDGALLIADKEEALVSEELKAGAYRGLFFGAALVVFSFILSALIFASI